MSPIPASSPHQIFDRSLVRRHIARARSNFSKHNALHTCTASELRDRIADVAKPLPDILDLSPFPIGMEGSGLSVSRNEIAFDEEYLPFAAETFDLVVSNLGFHWINDVPGALAQIRAILKPGGLFLAALIGENSLPELRRSIGEAEIEVSGGVSPRVSPMIDLLTASQLMQRAAFSLPVADIERIEILYGNVWDLMRDLRGMAQSNALLERSRRFSRRQMFEVTETLYRSHYGRDDRVIPASFEVVYLHGWK